MNKYFSIAVALLISFSSMAQYDYLSAKKMLVTGPFRPGSDTAQAPFWVGEIRQLVQGDSAQIFVGISKTAPKKWYKIGTIGSEVELVIQNGPTDDGADSLVTSPSANNIVIASVNNKEGFGMKIIESHTTGKLVYEYHIDTTNAFLKTWITSLGGEVYPIRNGDSIHLTNGIDTSSGVYSPIGGSGGTPGGADTQVQFNDGGAFGGDAGFTFNKTLNKIATDTVFAKTVRTSAVSGGTIPAAMFEDTSGVFVNIRNTGLSNSSTALHFQLTSITGTPVTTGAIYSAASGTGGILNFYTRSTSGTLTNRAILSNAGDFQINQGGTFTGGSFSATNHSSSTTTPNNVVYIYGSTSGVAAAGFGSAVNFRNENSAGSTALNATQIASIWRTATSAAEDAEKVTSVAVNGTLTELERKGKDAVTTTDATVTTIITLPIATGAYRELEFSARGVDGSNNVVMYRKMARVKNIAGTLTLLGSTDTMGTDFEDAALSACDVTVTTSGTNFLIQVTGIAATTITWTCNFTNLNL